MHSCNEAAAVQHISLSSTRSTVSVLSGGSSTFVVALAIMLLAAVEHTFRLESTEQRGLWLSWAVTHQHKGLRSKTLFLRENAHVVPSVG